MALRCALSRLSQEGGFTAAAPLCRAINSLAGFNTAQFASHKGIDEGVPALSGVVPITGPLSAAWCERDVLLGALRSVAFTGLLHLCRRCRQPANL